VRTAPREPEAPMGAVVAAGPKTDLYDHPDPGLS
jgi:hypothetical protein